MATPVIAVLAQARREVEERFFEQDAFSPDRAVEFETRMPAQQRYLERLIAEGVVHETAPGRYWLDLSAYRDQRRQRFVWSMWMLALFAVIAFVVWILKTFAH